MKYSGQFSEGFTAGSGTITYQDGRVIEEIWDRYEQIGQEFLSTLEDQSVSIFQLI